MRKEPVLKVKVNRFGRWLDLTRYIIEEGPSLSFRLEIARWRADRIMRKLKPLGYSTKPTLLKYRGIIRLVWLRGWMITAVVGKKRLIEVEFAQDGSPQSFQQ